MKTLNIFFLLSFYFSSCKLIRPLEYNIPKERNANLFPKRTILKGDNVFNFTNVKGLNNIGKTVMVDEKTLDPSGTSLDEMVKLHNTLSFMIVRNDSIIFEHYGNNYNDSNTVSSFSVAK